MEDDYVQCIGICQVDPDTGYCIGCGRRAIDFAPETSSPAAPRPPHVADIDGDMAGSGTGDAP